MIRLRHFGIMLQCVLWLMAVPSFAASLWDSPAAALASRVESILGPGQAQLQVRNKSSFPVSELPAIQQLFETHFKAHGLLVSGSESANLIRITLSENAWNLVWVAEVIEGNRTQVAIVNAGPLRRDATSEQAAVLLQGLPVLFVGKEAGKAATELDRGPVLAALSVDNNLVLLQAEALTVYSKVPNGYTEAASFPVVHGRPLGRDPRGMLLAASEGSTFIAYLPGVECVGTYASEAREENGATGVTCKDSDEPWPIVGSGVAPGASQRAFYNAMRNSFTGVVTPGYGLDLPPFLSAVQLVRDSGPLTLLNLLDGSVDMIENGRIKPLSGSRDWGSDDAVLATHCTVGSVVVVSGSGAPAGDSLRAYRIAGQAAVPVSEPLPLNGIIIGIASQSDGSALAITRISDKTGLSYYEVLRVATTCT